MQKTGIYAIVNLHNNKAYVGSTLRGFKYRWGLHRWELNRGTHRNRHLQAAWGKHDESAFEFRVLEIVTDDDLIAGREQAWIDRWKADYGVYNITTAAGEDGRYASRHLPEEHKQNIRAALLGREHSEETRRKIGNANRGQKRSPEILRQMSEIGKRTARRKTYTFIAPDGTVYENVANLPEFCKEHNLTPPAMYALNSPTSETAVHRGWTVPHKSYIQPQRFSFTDPNGVLYTDIENLTAFCRDHGLSVRAMSTVHKGERAGHKGWRAIGYAPPKRKVYAFVAPNGVVYEGITDLPAFCREYSLLYIAMSQIHNEKCILKSYKGWRKYYL